MPVSSTLSRAVPGVRRQLLVFAPAALAFLAAGVAFVQSRRIIEERRWVEHARDVLTQADRVRARLLDAETGQRGFLLTGDSSFLEPYRTAAPETRQALDRLRVRARDHAAQQPTIEALAVASEAKLAELELTLALAGSGRRDSALRVVRGREGKRLMDEARALVQSVERQEQEFLDARQASETRAERIGDTAVIASALLAIALGILINARLERGVVERDAALRDLTIANTQLEEQATELEQQTEEAQESAVAAEEARHQAEAANHAKSQFLSTMSHELRTPLNAIAGYTELMEMELRGPITDAQREDLTRIRRAGQHLLAMINDVLNFAKLEAGQVEFRPRAVPLREVFADLEALVRPQLAAKRLFYAQDCCHEDAAAAGPVVHADPERLRQILSNLLSNAIKFTAEGGRISVACDADDAAGLVRIRVRDSGRGIPQHRLAQIFDPFVQVDRHLTTESQQGVGLGLAISHDLAARMGGSLMVESEAGVGSTFTLTLPKAS